MEMFQFFNRKKSDNSFWKNREFFAEIYTIQNEKETKNEFLKNSLFYFENEKKEDEFSYKLVAKSLKDKNKQYGFPITKNCKAYYEFIENKMVKFFIELENDMILVLNFEGENQLESAGHFRHVFCKIMYQKNNKKCSSLILKENETKELFSLLPEKEKKKFSDEIKKLLIALKENKDNIIFAEIGTFANAELNNFSDAKIILKEAIFCLLKNSQFSYTINIYNSEFQNIYTIDINENLQYHTDMVRKCIIWADQKKKKVLAYNFCFEKDIINILAVLVGSLIMENTHKQSMKNLVNNKKDSWSQFYIGEEEEMVNEDIEDLKLFKKDNDYEIDFEKDFKSDFLNESVNKKNKIKGFVEMKSKNMALLNRGDEINVLKFDNNKNSFSFLNNLSFKSKKGDILNPSKIQMLDLDRKMIIQDSENDNLAYYCDLEKGKVIRDYNSIQKQKITDISVTDGKDSTFGNSNTFLTVGNRDINRFDVRQDSSVQNRFYSTKAKTYNFNKIYSVNPEKYFVASETGDLRLYNDLNSKTKARNLIPSLYGDAVVNLESSLDGKLILLTFKKYILLLRTFQNGKCCFKNMLKKTHKPKPILLKIHPNVLSKNNVMELNFNSAKFNEKKNEKESLIVATTNDLLVIWKLSKVLNGNYVSKDGYKLDGRIVDGEFLYDSNNLITTFEDDFHIKKVNRNLFK